MCPVVLHPTRRIYFYFVYSAIVNIDGDLVMHDMAVCPLLGQGILPMLLVNQMNFTRLKTASLLLFSPAVTSDVLMKRGTRELRC